MWNRDLAYSDPKHLEHRLVDPHLDSARVRVPPQPYRMPSFVALPHPFRTRKMLLLRQCSASISTIAMELLLLPCNLRAA